MHAERDVLTCFYNALGGATWNSACRTNWNTAADHSSWNGVLVYPGGTNIIAALQLPNCGLNGNMADAIACLSVYTYKQYLLYLIFSSNNLKGPTPSISMFSGLKYFVVDNNKLTTPPPSVAELADMQIFAMNNNLLSGTLPSFSGLNNLETVYMHSNFLFGPLQNWGGLPNLQNLVLKDNQVGSVH